MRREALLVLVTATTATAAPPALPDAQAKFLEKQGYKSPTLVFESPAFRIASAKKAGKARLVSVTADDKVVDAGKREKGTLAIEAIAATRVVVGMTQIEVSYDRPRPNQGSESTGSLWIVRADGSIACIVPGNSSTSIGKACGSSGSTSARPTLASDGSGGFTLDVRYTNSGNWSEPRGPKGACLNRSPVRSTNMQRWLIPAKGTCTKGTPPKPKPDDPDL